MTSIEEIVYLGIHGFVIALDRPTGVELWRVELKGSDFVNLVLDGEQLLATCKGEIFCLDAISGAQKWHNKLTGLGLGLITVVTAASKLGSIVPDAEMRKRQEQAAAAATSASVASH